MCARYAPRADPTPPSACPGKGRSGWRNTRLSGYSDTCDANESSSSVCDDPETTQVRLIPRAAPTRTLLLDTAAAGPHTRLLDDEELGLAGDDPGVLRATI